MNDQDRLRSSLNLYLQKAKEKNPSFSLRSFALQLDVPAGNLSQFLAGKRRFSSETMKAIAFKITDSPEERKNLLDSINEAELDNLRKLRSAASTSDYDAAALTAEEFCEIDEWYYYAVRTILSLKDPKYEIEWIARQLGITMTQAEKALKILFKYHLIELSSEARIVRTKKHLTTPDSTKKDPKTHAVKIKLHEQHIRHALESLNKYDVSKRDITWVNIPANPVKLDRARELIRKFQDDMLTLLEDEESSEVYRLTVQLCPLSPEGL